MFPLPLSHFELSFWSQTTERGQSDSRKDKSCSLGQSRKTSWKRRVSPPPASVSSTPSQGTEEPSARLGAGPGLASSALFCLLCATEVRMLSKANSQITLFGIPAWYNEQIPNTVNYVSRAPCPQRSIYPPQAANYESPSASGLGVAKGGDWALNAVV